MAAAVARDCTVITSTYNEPLITAEWALDVFTLARRAGLLTDASSPTGMPPPRSSTSWRRSSTP